MNAPTASEVEGWSQVNWGRLGADLEVLVPRANAYIEYVTGQTWAAMPTNLEKLAQQAAQMRTEQIGIQGRHGHAESAAENEVVQSFSAGLYSESRRDTRSVVSKVVNTWPSLDELLWMLMTDDRRAYWLGWISGETVPDWGVVEVNWHGATYSAVAPNSDWVYESLDPWAPVLDTF